MTDAAMGVKSVPCNLLYIRHPAPDGSGIKGWFRFEILEPAIGHAGAAVHAVRLTRIPHSVAGNHPLNG